MLTSARAVAFALTILAASGVSELAIQELERRDALAEITAQALREHVTTLASDELGGRRTGTAGAAAAARYLADVLERAGVEPAGDEGTFLQGMPMGLTEYSALPQLSLRLADGSERPAVYGVDFDVVAGAGEITSSTLIFASAQEQIPREAPENGVLYVSGSSRERRAWLEAAGCPEGEGWGLIVTRGSSTIGRERTDPPRRRNEIAPTPIVRVRGEVLQSFEAGEVRHVAYSAPATMEALDSYNVVGRIPGVGTAERPELARETIVFSAHYDHLGERGESGDSEQVDTIYNGADDDASGCAAVLELARAFGKGPKPARTLIFLLATGEEMGLIGTRFYLEQPAEPLANTVTNLNFEMIGRPDELVGGAGKMWLTGYERSNLGEAFQAAGLPVSEDPRPEQNFFRRSDNFAFARIGIVAQTLSTYNLHTDYHTVWDEADKLDYEHMQACVRAAYSGAKALADGSLTPAWKPGGNPAEESQRR